MHFAHSYALLPAHSSATPDHILHGRLRQGKGGQRISFKPGALCHACPGREPEKEQKVKALLVVVGVLSSPPRPGRAPVAGKEREIQARGVDAFIALDVSQSMLADDYKPDRLTLAKSLLKKMVDNLQGNRIGVIAFAGAAYIECPLTVDVSAVKIT